MSNYFGLIDCDVVNGDGIGTSLFFSGCDFHCKGCFNSEAWDKNYGSEFNKKTINRIISNLSNDYVDHLSILGGEPFSESNIDDLYFLIWEVRSVFQNKKIWIWSGFRYEILENMAKIDGRFDYVLNNINYLIDGQYEEDKKDLSLRYYGSTNQRCIDIKATIEMGGIVIHD